MTSPKGRGSGRKGKGNKRDGKSSIEVSLTSEWKKKKITKK